MARMAKGLVDMACLVPYSRKGVLWELRVQMHLPVDKRSGPAARRVFFCLPDPSPRPAAPQVVRP